MNMATDQASTNRLLVGIFFSVTLHAVLLLAFSLSKHLPSLKLEAKQVQTIAPLPVMLVRKNIEPLTTIHAAKPQRFDLPASVQSSPLTVLQNSATNMNAVDAEEPLASLPLANQANDKLVEATPAEHSVATPESSARPDYAVNPKPEYPRLLREHGVGGTVWLRVRVDSEGRPADVKLAKGSGYRLFDEAALRVVALWRFIPAQTGEQKLASWVEFPIRFTLNG